MDKKKLRREDVYNKIWASSTKKAAEKYDVDYADLLRKCHQANIPIPSTKYHLALQNGDDTAGLKVELPPRDDQYIFVKTNQTSVQLPADHELPDVDMLAEEFSFLNDPDKAHKIAEVLVKTRQRKNWRTTPEIKAYKASVKQWKSDDRPRYRYNNYQREEAQPPKFIDNLSPQGMRRAYRLINEFVTILKQVGEQVTDDLSVKIGDDEVEYELKEDQDKVPHEMTSQEKKELADYEREKQRDGWAIHPRIRKYDHPYNGHLRIRFIVSGSHKRFVKDSKTAPLEEQLPAILMAFYKTYLETKAKREEREEWQRQQELERKREEERRQRVENEKKHVAALINEAKDYYLANIVRDYIDACKGQDPDRVAWMQGVADWLDPLVSGNNPYLEKRQHGASDKQKASYLDEESSHNDSFLNYLDML